MEWPVASPRPIARPAYSRATNRAKRVSFSIAKYGAQTGSDWQWFPDAGNGILTNGSNVVGNDPADAATACSATQTGYAK